MLRRVRYKEFDQISIADMLVYSKLPEHSFWSNVETKIDFSFADKLCSVLYSGRGQHPYAPSLKLKIHLTQAYLGISDRQVEEKIIGDLFIKRFLGLPVDFFGFDHSTIGLDRSRMGAVMFKACHLYILAQMYSHGIWGDHNEQWIIDSFAANLGLPKTGAYRLIQQAMIRILQHLKRSNRNFYDLTLSCVALDSMYARLPYKASEAERMLAFSKLVAQAYGLLQWFLLEDVTQMFNSKLTEKAQETSLSLQSNLKRILEENSRIAPPADDDDLDKTQDQISYEKIPLKERPKDRIVSANDPEARIAKKNKSTDIRGYKIQNLCTTSGVILGTEVVPANEHDREAMFLMVKEIQDFFGVSPRSVLGDTLYGHGQQRVLLDSIGIPTVAPVITTQNPTKLYDISEFTYDRERDRYLCPNEKVTKIKRHIPQSNGWQYYFDKKDCSACALREACTTGKTERRIFHSDYYEFYEAAKVYNESLEGRVDHLQRLIVERKNQELKNDCGLGRPKTKNKQALSIKSILGGIVVNLKLTLRKLIAPKPGFVRRVKTS